MRHVLPVMQTWLDPTHPLGGNSRWWVWVAYGAAISILGGAFSSNMPLRPREIVKSVGVGFALNAADILKRVGMT